MRKERLSKKSIAFNVAHRTAVILSVTLLVLLSAAYLMVSYIIRANTENLSEHIVTMLADDIREHSAAAGVPISPEYPEISTEKGNYICERFDVDYTFVMVPEPEKNRSTYITVSYKDPKMAEQFPDHYTGHVDYSEYTKNELDLWHGRKQYSHIVVNKSFGHEMITETLITDSYGNRVSVGVDINNSEVYRDIFRYFIIIGILLLITILVINLISYYVIRKQVSDPAGKLSRAMQNFITNGNNEKLSAKEMRSTEYEMIAEAFDSMSDNIKQYIDDIETLTRETERHQTELDIASRIQQGFLPEGNYSNDKFAISAVMHPAKEVGGDLYDYVRLDENRVLIVIADVSGKGIAASLFMAVTLILIRQFARLNLDTDSILERTNDALMSNNPGLLFVTAFVGIYDSETGILSYSNAGHCPPYIVGNGIRKATDAQGVILGVFDDEKYSCGYERLESGESVFLYTDGVTEAMNSEKVLFGEKQLEKVLQSCRYSMTSDIINQVMDAVAVFTAGSEQHDDITMLSLTRL